MKSALVVGGSGYLGRRLLHTLGGRGVGTYAGSAFSGGIGFRAESSRLADIEDVLPTDLRHVFFLYGAINPELCAREPAATRKINVDSNVALMSECFARGLVPVFMSTDYVYDGTKGDRTEDEVRSPTTEYGRQKSEVEAWLETRSEPWLICRSSKIVSGDRNIHSVLGQWLEDMEAGRTMRCAVDQIITPGHVDDIAAVMVALADLGSTGIYHVAGPTSLSRYDLAALLVDALARADGPIAAKLERAHLGDFPFLEARPLDTSLSTRKLQAAPVSPLRSMAQVCGEIALAESRRGSI
ncbi:hypothetical protein Sa4125_14890 [Aureimonas sp. SA4125]|uniref:SDR family oxidoreductase n=1 Tax=Aureimonas sp. SA4125 TaxID=2826993 RepID=UPI001CC3BCD1|nr:sugar nucleotide-binding protein [Aureimonas sp. SA4125]BDA83947.1 hypothetical protein Sa4125_14890 [Aureimonas sp. SA4125]